MIDTVKSFYGSMKAYRDQGRTGDPLPIGYAEQDWQVDYDGVKNGMQAAGTSPRSLNRHLLKSYDGCLKYYFACLRWMHAQGWVCADGNSLRYYIDQERKAKNWIARLLSREEH